MNQLLRDLKVIGRIEENGRISTVGRSNISIESDTAFTGIMRFLWGDSRERAAESIANVVTAVIEISDSLLESNCIQAKPVVDEDTPDDYLKGEREKVIGSLQKVSRELHGAVRGISNLSRTYKNDQVLWAKLEQLMGDIEHHVSKVDQRLAKLKVQAQEGPEPISPALRRGYRD